jgi:outer membrane protein assembly factor BamB
MATRALPLAPGLVLLVSVVAAFAEKSPGWPQFHGPGGVGVAEAAAPVDFGPEKAVLWKAAVPSGHSSPVVWGKRVFLTAFDAGEKKLVTLALDRATGRVLWRRPVTTEAIERVHAVGSPAASTPVTDGRSLFVYFGSYGLVAYDFDGRERWSRPLPMVKTRLDQGSGTSPVLAEDRVLLDVHLETGSYLWAVLAKNGETAWKAPKKEFTGGWSTPVVWREGEESLVGILNPGRFSAYGLRDGRERWFLEDLPLQTCSTPAVGDGLIFVSASGTQGEKDNVTLPPSFDEMLARHDANGNGQIEVDEIPEALLLTNRGASGGAGDMSVRRLLRLIAGKETPPTTYAREQWDAVLKIATQFLEGPNMRSAVLAVRTGGKGEVSKSNIAWTESRGVPEVPSPLLYRDRVYLVKSGGIVITREAATGKTVYQARLDAPGGYYASPVAAAGRIYAAADTGTIAVFEAGDALRVLARNDLGEPIFATPAIVDGTLFVRTASHLYAFGSTPRRR